LRASESENNARARSRRGGNLRESADARECLLRVDGFSVRSNHRSSRRIVDCSPRSVSGNRERRRSRETERDDRKRISVSLFSLSSFLFFFARERSGDTRVLREKAERKDECAHPALSRVATRAFFGVNIVSALISPLPATHIVPLGELYFAGSRFTTGPRDPVCKSYGRLL